MIYYISSFNLYYCFSEDGIMNIMGLWGVAKN